MKLSDLLKTTKPLLADGAMGTYYSEITGLDISMCELSNRDAPGVIEEIHRAYVKAGARLLRTNTFSANTGALSLPLSEVLTIIKEGYRLAVSAAQGKALVACDIGAIFYPGDGDRDPFSEYCAIADAFLSCGGSLFLFETLAETEPFCKVAAYIKQKNPDAEILLSFALSPDGRTRAGIPLSALLPSLKENRRLLSGVGLNCGSGPMHLAVQAKTLCDYAKAELGGLPVLALPNAGYPSVEQQRTVFMTPPTYFAQKTAEIASGGAAIIGGCCGTTPEHIALLRDTILHGGGLPPAVVTRRIIPQKEQTAPKSTFKSGIHHNAFVIAAELDPPYGSDLHKLLSAAHTLKSCGVDIITISDSPLSRAKLDSVVCAARIKRECGVDTLPHLCCRDKNANALRASLLAAHSEGIRAVLCVTGDHVPESDRGFIKPVFNLTSLRLMELIRQMNEDVFKESPMLVGGALNPGVPHPESESKRTIRKVQAGASFFLTQPVFDDTGFSLIQKARSLGAKVLVGIMPLVSYRNALYMSNEVPGIHIPQECLSRFSPDMNRDEAAEAGVEIAVKTAALAREAADGFYFMTPFNRADIIAEILKRLRDRRIIA